MSTYFDKSKNLRDLARDIADHLNRTDAGHDVDKEPRVPKGSGATSGEWTRGGGGIPEPQVALRGEARRQAEVHRPELKDLLNNLTNSALSEDKLESVVDQLIDHLGLFEALDLRNIQGGSTPVTITPRQQQIIEDHINQLSPDVRDIVQKAFEQAIANRTIICPTCRR